MIMIFPVIIYDCILNIVECHCIEGLLDYYMSEAILYASEIRSDYGVANAKWVLTVKVMLPKTNPVIISLILGLRVCDAYVQLLCTVFFLI